VRRLVAGLLGIALLGLGSPLAAAAPTPTVAVSDRTDLVHGHHVVVRGRHWNPDLFAVTATICAGLDDDDQCEQIGWDQPGPTGLVRIPSIVDVVVDLPDGPVDCRVSACWLVVFAEGAYPEPDPAPVVVPVTFDANGPDPTRRPVDVSPTTGLVDGSVLTVQGEDFTGGGFPRSVVMLPCRLPVLVQDDCDALDLREVGIARDGLLDTTYRIDAVLDLAGQPHDCRTDPCGLMVMDGGWEEPVEDLSEAGLVALTFDPDAPLRPPPSGSVTPAAGLVDDQPVQVQATGFDPDQPVLIQQCVTPVDDGSDPEGCHAERPGTFARTDANGALSRRLRVFTMLVDWLDPYDCRVETCGLVLTQTSPYRRLVVDIGFDPAAPELEPQVTVRPHRGLGDRQVVTIRGSGFRAWTRILLVECPPGNYPGDTFGCDRRTRQTLSTGAPDGGEPGESFTVPYRVRRQVQNRDCAVRRCVLYALSDETIPDAVEVPLRFRGG
jgi:hypothetical protein